MLVALESGRIDVGSLAPPFSIDAEAKGTFEPVFKYADMIGPNQAGMWIAQRSWLDKNRPALLDFFEDFLRSRRWFLDPKNRDDAIKLVSGVTKRPPASYQSWLLTNRDWFRDPNGMPNVDMIQRNIDASVKAKTLDAGLSVKDYVDTSFLQEARKRVDESGGG
jgi:sulfonate transport system substrate-binding protein